MIDISPGQNWRPQGSKTAWAITGSLHTHYDAVLGNLKGRELFVNINGDLAVHGMLSNMATGELTGSYRGHAIGAICASEQKTPNWIDVRCTVLIDNERTVTLTF